MLVRPLFAVDRAAFAPMLEESVAHGTTFVERLVREWHSGDNRFDRPGERLFGAFDGDALVGCGGINVDPYANDPELGRVRHVYVLAHRRRAGVGRALLHAIMAHARPHFRRVRLKTETLDAVRFYESLGFASRVVGDAFELARTLEPGH
jgi:GNAT superfamily N-acetyltransferase